VHRGLSTVAVRVPAHAVPRRLAAAAGHLLTATSANRSGSQPAATADDVDASLLDHLSVILDAGPTPGGLPSTIVDARGSAPQLLRAGAVSWERVLQSLK
jgi:L-threonylcarbamoyladenylate synthase